MDCPNCKQPLVLRYTVNGMGVDLCEKCGGIWLDEGELSFQAKRPDAEILLDQIPEKLIVQDKISPRTGSPLQQVNISPGLSIYRCPVSRGWWIDSDQLPALSEWGAEFNLADDKNANRFIAGAGKTALMTLPNLFIRSTVSLLGLYLLLGLFMVFLVEYRYIGINTALVLGIAVVLIQFILGPWLMDLSIFLMYKSRDIPLSELPPYLQEFVEEVCRTNRMKTPRFKLIMDGSPEAFTYGHVPSNARIVISQGILDLLEPEEVKAVVGHEIGHALHWDMLLMTMAQLIPLVFYYIYKTVSEMKSDNKKDGGLVAVTAISSYLLYLLSQYVVLFLSRTREYYADRFSGYATGNPGALASALVGIAYGLAARKTDDGGKEDKRKPQSGAVGALGIFDEKTARALAVCTYSPSQVPGRCGDEVKAAMRWDLWNPWARWYELNSTHPLVAHRLLYLSNQSLSMGQHPYVIFDEKQPESYWDEFFVDLLIKFLPLLLPLLVLSMVFGFSWPQTVLIPALIAACGLGLVIVNLFTYPKDHFGNASVAALLKHVKVSGVRPVACVVNGVIIGRGVPGYIFSEDFVLKDQTGIIFADMRQPLRIWEYIFGIFMTPSLIGQEVTVKGWYRRQPVPYIEIQSVRSANGTKNSYVPAFTRFFAWSVLVVGLVWLLAVLY